MEKNFDTSFFELMLTMGILIVLTIGILLLAKEIYSISISIVSYIANVAKFIQQAVNTRVDDFAISVAAGIFVELIKYFFVKKYLRNSNKSGQQKHKGASKPDTRKKMKNTFILKKK